MKIVVLSFAFSLKGREEIESLEAEHLKAPHLRLLQKNLQKKLRSEYIQKMITMQQLKHRKFFSKRNSRIIIEFIRERSAFRI